MLVDTFMHSLGDRPQREIGYNVCFSGNLPTVSQRTWAVARSPAVSALQCSTSLRTLGIVIFFLAILVSVQWCHNDLFCGCRTNDASLHPRGRLPARLQPFPVGGQRREDCADLVYSSGGRPQGWPNAQHPGYSSMMTLDS